MNLLYSLSTQRAQEKRGTNAKSIWMIASILSPYLEHHSWTNERGLSDLIPAQEVAESDLMFTRDKPERITALDPIFDDPCTPKEVALIELIRLFGIETLSPPSCEPWVKADMHVVIVVRDVLNERAPISSSSRPRKVSP